MKITKQKLKQIIKEELGELRQEFFERFADDASGEETNMNRNLRVFAQWAVHLNEYVKEITGEDVMAGDIERQEFNLYDAWLDGLSPEEAGQKLLEGTPYVKREASEPDPCSPHPIGGEDDWDVEARLHRNKCGQDSAEGEGIAGETHEKTLADYKEHPEWFN